MPLRPPWSIKCSTASTHEQIVSTLELKLHALSKT